MSAKAIFSTKTEVETQSDLKEIITKAFVQNFEEKYKTRVHDVELKRESKGKYSIQFLRAYSHPLNESGKEISYDELIGDKEIMRNINSDVNNKLMLEFPINGIKQLREFRSEIMIFFTKSLIEGVDEIDLWESEKINVQNAIEYSEKLQGDFLMQTKRRKVLTEYLNEVEAKVNELNNNGDKINAVFNLSPGLTAKETALIEFEKIRRKIHHQPTETINFIAENLAVFLANDKYRAKKSISIYKAKNDISAILKAFIFYHIEPQT